MVKIISSIWEQLKRGFQYKKAGMNISMKNNNSMSGLHSGAKIIYNARSAFHSPK